MSIDLVDYCSPSRKHIYLKTGSCLKKDELEMIAKSYNKINKDEPIALNRLKNKESLLHELQTKMHNVCLDNKEYCWVNILSNSKLNTIAKTSLRPSKPLEWYLNDHEWLSNYDILDVMKQYEIRYKQFKFLGVFPRDFESLTAYGKCVAMCSFSVKDFLLQGFKEFGIVFNMDTHTQPGSHWVALYANFNPKKKKFGIAYYDSAGKKPPSEIWSFICKIKGQVLQHFDPSTCKLFKTKYNPLQHQFKNTECGMFSMFFIIHCLENTDKTYAYTRTSIGDDDEIFQLRNKLYSPNILAVSK